MRLKKLISLFCICLCTICTPWRINRKNTNRRTKCRYTRCWRCADKISQIACRNITFFWIEIDFWICAVIIFFNNINCCTCFHLAHNWRAVRNIAVSTYFRLIRNSRLLSICVLHINILWFNIIQTVLVINLVMTVLRRCVHYLNRLIYFVNTRFYIIRWVGSCLYHKRSGCFSDSFNFRRSCHLIVNI